MKEASIEAIRKEIEGMTTEQKYLHVKGKGNASATYQMCQISSATDKELKDYLRRDHNYDTYER